MQKIFLYFIIILSLIIGLIGCPNNPETDNGSNNDQTEQTQEAKNKATSGLEKDLTVIGKIEDTTCDITLNAENGTFTATQSSRSDEVSYSGEFFYYNGKLQLKVTSKNEQTLSSDEIICLTAEVAQTALTSDEPATFAFETNTVTEYETAKTEFRVANSNNNTTNIDPSVLKGMRFVADTLTFSQSITQSVNGTQIGEPQTLPGCVLDFTADNKVMIDILFSYSHELMNYTISGNTVKIEFYLDLNTGEIIEVPFVDASRADHVGENFYQASLTGTISDDGSRINDFKGEFIHNMTSYDNTGNTTGKQKIVFSFSNGTFTKQGEIKSLAGKTYKATKAKLNSENMTGNIELKFTGTYDFTLKQDDKSLIQWSNGYMLYGNNIVVSAMYTFDNNSYSSSLRGTISSDYAQISLSGTNWKPSIGTSTEPLSVEFDFTLDSDTGNNTDTTTTIPSGTDTTFSLTGKTYADLTVDSTDFSDGVSKTVYTADWAGLVFSNDTEFLFEIPSVWASTKYNYTINYTERKITININTPAGNYSGTTCSGTIIGIVSNDLKSISVSGEIHVNNDTFIVDANCILKADTTNSGTDTTFSLNGSRYYCESMNTSTTMTVNGNNTTSVGTAEAICDFTEDGVFTNFFPNGSSAAYTISGNTMTIDVSIDYTANGTNVSGSGTLTCVLSDDRKSLSLTGEVSLTSVTGNASVVQNIAYSGIFVKSADIVDLTGKAYTAVSAKIGDETVTNSQTFKLDFTDRYNVKFTQGTQSICSLESLPYFVIGDKININAGTVTINDVMYSGVMLGTISSDYSSITIDCNLINIQSGADNTFDWTFSQQ